MLTQEQIDKMSDQELAVWYNDHVIYPDKVRLNCIIIGIILSSRIFR